MSLFKRFKKEKEEKESNIIEADGSTKYPAHVVTLNSNSFDDFIDKYEFVIVDFYSDICIPCKIIAPRIRKLSKDYKGRVAFGKISVNQNKEIAKKYKVSGVPTLILFKSGKRIGSMVGVKSIKVIKDKIESMIKK